jgi:4'-phosphopantetheinyl transferase EntD
MIKTLFPAGVTTLEATPAMWEAPLLPEEEACLSPRAVAKRRREFAAGRACARAALARLGVVDFPLRSGPDRTPIWPPDIVGSLSHCPDFCGVAVTRRGAIAGLGLDVERARPLQDRVAAMICTEAERDRLTRLPDLPAPLWAMVLFCAKEGVYKCFYPLARMHLDFHDVEIDLDPPAGSFTARVIRARWGAGETAGAAVGGAAEPPIRVMRGRFAWNDAHVFAGVTLTAAELGAPHGGAPGRPGS